MRPPGFLIGPVAVAPPLVLAPMAGLTDRAFRRAVRRCGGAGLVVGEIASCEALTRGARKALDLIRIREDEHPIALQISGGNPERMAGAAVLCEEAGADAVDINMGCPVPKITSGSGGCALMREPERAEAVVRAVRAAVRVPVTVKMRLGWSPSSANYLDLGRRFLDSGVSALTLHARTRDQGYSGRAAWEHIGLLKGALPIPVIGNGDATGPEQVLELFRATGCDGVMVGRACLKNPWIFRQSVELWETGSYREPALEERLGLIAEHFRDLVESERPEVALHRMKSFLGKYTKGIPRAASFRATLEGHKFAPALLEAFRRWADSLLSGPRLGE